MRVISGEFKGRRFGPKMEKWPTRPTTDYAKESIFNILDNLYYFEGKRVLDLFGGTGGVSLEFISRGVKDVTIVEDYIPCVKYINSLMDEFDCTDKVTVLAMDVLKFLENNKQQYNIIFVDPPYGLIEMQKLPDMILDNSMIAEDGIMLLEHSNLNDFSSHSNCVKVKKYGQTIVSFFEPTKS